MVLDTNAQIDDDLARALRVAGNKQRLEVLQILDRGASSVGRIAQELGLSRRSTARHLAVLQDCGLVMLMSSSENGRLYAVDREKAAILNASFVSVMGRVASGTPPGPIAASEEPVLAIVPQTPEGCTQCENASFVRQVLDDLDQTLAKAREYQARLRQMSSQVLTAQEEERKRIARELHDDTAQALTSVLVRLRLLQRSERDGRLQAALTELRDLTAGTLDGVRRLAVDLRPPMLDDLGLAAALRAHLEDFSQRWQIKTALKSSGAGRFPPDVELALYRVAQEALSNVAKHAGASQVVARLIRSASTLRLVIEDDGRGFDVQRAKASRDSGLGLFGMEERLALIGGTLLVESAAGAGTRVCADVPLLRKRRQ